jgi:Tfp pilus assembly protein PilO
MLTVWIAGGLLCIVVLAWLCLSILAQRVSQNTNDLLEAQVTIEANYRQQQNLSNLSRQVTSIQENAKELNRAFADRTKALAFVEYIEETAAKYGIEQAFTPVEPTRTGTPSQTQYLIEERGFKLTLKGKTQDLFRFLTELEANPIYVLTTEVTLNRDDGANASLDLQGTIPWH